MTDETGVEWQLATRRAFDYAISSSRRIHFHERAHDSSGIVTKTKRPCISHVHCSHLNQTFVATRPKIESRFSVKKKCERSINYFNTAIKYTIRLRKKSSRRKRANKCQVQKLFIK